MAAITNYAALVKRQPSWHSKYLDSVVKEPVSCRSKMALAW